MRLKKFILKKDGQLFGKVIEDLIDFVLVII
jgi:hypothetical protein